MSVSSTLLSAAAKQVELAFQAVIAVPGMSDDLPDIAYRLDGIRKELEAKVAPQFKVDGILQEELGFE